MKIAALTWDSNNVGDDIQTAAVEQHLPRTDFYINREQLKYFDGPECLLVMNGWFDPTDRNWPPSHRIRPIFFGFHAHPRSRAVLAKHVDYLHKHAPIGCRDRATLELIQSLGVQAYLSLCSTLTFPKREDNEPRDLFLVDTDLNRFARSVRNKLGLTARSVSHAFMNIETEKRMDYARALLDRYGATGAMVITSRIHCAMPCVAMGIPVMFIARRNRRIEIVEEIGLTLYDPRSLAWRLGLTGVRKLPEPLDISAVKERIRSDLLSRIDTALTAGV